MGCTSAAAGDGGRWSGGDRSYRRCTTAALAERSTSALSRPDARPDPHSGRTLPEHGAEVLLVSAPQLPSVKAFVLDTGQGKHQGQRAREVVQEVWAQALRLPDGKGGFVQATCLVAKETEPPAGDKPVEWRLLTNLPVASLEQAARMIDWYRVRWEIEMFFHVLKNGCRIEALQLRCIEKIERALVLYTVVAWRIARLMRLGRSCPDLDAQLMFEPDEWQAAYMLNKKRLPDKPPTLNEVVRLVARLGGFLAGTGDGEPGVKTIWLGVQRILDFAVGIRFSRELQAQGTCV